MSVQSSPIADASSATTAEASEPTCPCGHGRDHHRVSRDGAFQPWSWILMMFGVSSRPVRVDWRCRMCNVTFASTTDPEILRRRLF